MLKACILDLDGTLLNTLPTIAHYSNLALREFGFEEISAAHYQTMCRLPFHEYYETLLRYGGCPADEIESKRDPIGHYDRSIYLEDPLYLTEPFPGISDTLIRLKEKGIKLAVLTNKPDQIAQSVVSKLFPGTFDLCVGYTGSNHSKPDPRALWNIIKQMSLAKEECMYVGDTDIDVITANRAEVFSVAVSWGYQSADDLAELKPSLIISEPEELLSLFD